MEYKSTIVSLINKMFAYLQNTKFAAFGRDSLLFKNIDNITLLFIFLTVISGIFCSSSVVGAFALAVVFLRLIKLIFLKGEKIILSRMDIWILVFFAFVTLSLFASSYFILSFKGYVKTLTYTLFYFAMSHYLLQNKDKIKYVILLIATLLSFEAVIGILQSLGGVAPISGWQDTSNLDVTEIIARCYGTIKPYNPNLYAGYIVIALPSLIAVLLNFMVEKKNKLVIFSSVLITTSVLAIIYSGCRGAYMGLFTMGIATGIVLLQYFGGFKKLSAKAKSLVACFLSAFMLFIVMTPAIYKRIFSIFAMRQDSSTSFRMNVYQSAFQMLKDNIFLGIGVGNKNFREVYGLYMRTGFDALACYSVPLELAVESGIFALISFIGFLYQAFKKCISVMRGNYKIQDKILVFSIFLMLIGVFTHGFVDTVWFRPQLQILFWFYMASLNTYFLK